MYLPLNVGSKSEQISQTSQEVPLRVFTKLCRAFYTSRNTFQRLMKVPRAHNVSTPGLLPTLSPNIGTRQQTRTMAATRRTLRSSASVHLSRISQSKVTPQDAQQVLAAAFTADDYIDCIRDLVGWNIDPQAYIDGLDQVSSGLFMLVNSTLTTVPHQTIDALTPGSEFYGRCLQALGETCGVYGILPSSHLMPQGLTLVTSGMKGRPFASGGFADIWKARNDNGQIFAIKHFRTYEVDDLRHVKKVLRVCHSVGQYFSLESLSQKYCRKVAIGRRIRHENILSIEGAAPDLFEFCMVSKWMDNGNMLKYVRTYTQVDRASLVSSFASFAVVYLSILIADAQLLGITRGLHHLHSGGIIHGDLKGVSKAFDYLCHRHKC